MGVDGRHRALLALAQTQWQVLKVGHIREIGFSRREIEGLVAKSVLHPRFKGIYTYGPDRIPVNGVLLAAQWSVGEDAYLTCRTALALAKVCGQFLRRIEVAVPRRTVRARQPPVFLSRTNHAPEQLRRDGPLRFTTVERAIVDLSARGATVQEQRRLIREAVHLKRLNHAVMAGLIDAHAGQPGIAALIEAYGSYLLKPDGKSGLERSFDTRLKTRPWIPEPLSNHHIEANGVHWEIDRYWPDQKLGVELHGGGYHDAHEDLNKDTFKDVKLGLIGIELMAFTDDRWELEPDSCLDDLEQALAQRGWHGRAA